MEKNTEAGFRSGWKKRVAPADAARRESLSCPIKILSAFFHEFPLEF